MINPNLNEIGDILKFLASPLIGYVGKIQDFFETLVGFDMKEAAVILDEFRVH
nr:hypothetical protein [uncultured Blautia sp.]